MAEASLLQHLHGVVRTGGSGAAAAFECATAQLHVLAAPALRHGDAADLADELVDRAEQLVGSKQAASRLMGLRLLHASLADCDRRTFLRRHSQWAALLLATLRSEQQQQQQAAQAEAQAAAPPASAAAAEACACLASYFGRVGRMLEVPGLRRDGAAAASKLAALLLHQQGGQQQQQQQQQQAASQQAPPPLLALAQGQRALLAALAALPASFRQQHKALEAALLPLLLRAAPPGGAALLAACVAALPRIPGDATAWSAQCQRLLATAHRLADQLLLRLDDPQLAAAARATVDPAAQPLAAAGGATVGAAGGAAAVGSEAYGAGFGQLEAVLRTLRCMLSGAHPAAVPLPAAGLLLLAGRLLSVDDGDDGGGAVPAASARLPQLRLHLPALHAAALRLLRRLLAAAGAAAAPHFAGAARLLAELLQRSAAAGGGAIASSALARCELYAASRQLLVTAGVGVTRHLAPALLQAASFELYGRLQAAQDGAAAADAEGPARKKARKGRQAAAAAAALEDAGAASGTAPLDDLGSAVQQRDLAVQAAALQALEALCGAGGALLSPAQRRQLDDAACHLAATSAAAARHLSADAEAAVGPALAALHLAALRLLLATVLAPAPHRPPHLAPALRLFHQGCGGGGCGCGGPLAVFCRQALLSCEALLHPRALPPPAPPRPAAPADAAGGGGEAPPLGMPRFWSGVDAALLLQQDALQRQQQQQQQVEQQLQQQVEQQEEQAERQQAEAAPPPGHIGGPAGGADESMAEAGERQQQQQQLQQPGGQPGGESGLQAATPALQQLQHVVAAAPTQQQQLQHPAAAPVSSMAAMLSAAPLAPAPLANAGPVPHPPQPQPQPQPGAFAPSAAPLAPAAPAAAAAAAVVAAAAAAEVTDSEGSLPEIDSGQSESDGEAST